MRNAPLFKNMGSGFQENWAEVDSRSEPRKWFQVPNNFFVPIPGFISVMIHRIPTNEKVLNQEIIEFKV